MSAHVAKLTKELHNVSKILDIHYQSLSRTGFTGTHPDDAEVVSSSIKTINNNDLQILMSKLELDVGDAKKRTLAAIAFMNEMQKVQQALDSAISTMIQHAPDLDTLYSSNFSRSSAISGSTVEEILKTQRSATSNVEHVKSHMNDPEMIDELVALADPDLETTLAADTDTSNFNLAFYAVLLQRLINTHLHDPGMVPRIMRHVETLKSKALGPASEARTAAASDTPMFQKLVQTFRLVPSEPSMQLGPLIAGLFPDYKVKVLDASTPDALRKSLEKAASSLKNIGFIAWSKYAADGSIREHHFRILTDPAYLEQVLGSKLMPGEGVSSKYVVATDTLTDLVGPKKKVDFLLVAKTDVVKFWVILETLDGESFRYLKPWGNDTAQIPVHWFDGLIDDGKPSKSKPAKPSKSGGDPEFYETNLEKVGGGSSGTKSSKLNIQAVPSPRVENYHVILQDEILKHLHPPYISSERLTRDESVHEDIFWRNLRTTIRKASMKDFAKIKGLKIENVTQRLKADKNYYDNLARHIAAQIETDGETRLPAETTDLAERELYISSFQQMDKLRAGLAKTMEAAFQELRRKKQPGSKVGNLEQLWSDTLDEGLARYINRRSGIFITLDNKSEILRKCLSV